MTCRWLEGHIIDENPQEVLVHYKVFLRNYKNFKVFFSVTFSFLLFTFRDGRRNGMNGFLEIQTDFRPLAERQKITGEIPAFKQKRKIFSYIELS